MVVINNIFKFIIFICIIPIAFLNKLFYSIHLGLNYIVTTSHNQINKIYIKKWKNIPYSSSLTNVCEIKIQPEEVEIIFSETKINLSEHEFQEVLDYMSELNKKTIKPNGNT